MSIKDFLNTFFNTLKPTNKSEINVKANNTVEVQKIRAKFSGIVISVNVSPGDKVCKGEVLLVIETMQMEIKIPSPVTGVVQAITVGTGSKIETGQVLVVIG